MSHHGFDDKQLNKELLEAMKKSFGEYPDGRLNADDAGAMPMAVGIADGRVVLRFPKPVHWIGMTPNEAIGLAELLIQHARNAGARATLKVTIG